jgi:hypothetical protein
MIKIIIMTTKKKRDKNAQGKRVMLIGFAITLMIMFLLYFVFSNSFS